MGGGGSERYGLVRNLYFFAPSFCPSYNNFLLCNEYPLGADYKNNETTKQLNNFWTNRKVETKLYLLPIGPDRIV